MLWVGGFEHAVDGSPLAATTVLCATAMPVLSGKLVKSFLPLLGIIYVAWAFARQVCMKDAFQQ